MKRATLFFQKFVLTCGVACAVLLSHPSSVRSSELKDAVELNRKMMELFQEKNYQEAVSVGEQVVSLLKEALGPYSLDLAASLNNLALLYEKLGNTEKAKEHYWAALDIYERALGPGGRDTINSLKKLADLYKTEGNLERAEMLYGQVLERNEKALGKDHPYVGQDLENLAGVYLQEKNCRTALPLLKDALAIKEKNSGSDTLDFVQILQNLGECSLEGGDYLEALGYFGRALKLVETTLEPDDPSLLPWLDNLALLHSALHHYSEAVRFYGRALSIREKSLGPDHPETVGTVAKLADAETAYGDYGEAYALYQRALQVPSGPDVRGKGESAEILLSLGSLFQEVGLYKKSEELYLKVRSIYGNEYGANHLSSANLLQKLGSLYDDMGFFNRAESLFRESVDVVQAERGPDHPDTVAAIRNFGLFYLNNRYFEKALPLLTQVKEIHEKSFGAVHPVVTDDLDHIAQAREGLGNFSEAETMYESIVQNREDVMGSDSPETLEAIGKLVSLLQQTGNYSQAETLLEDTNQLYEKSLGADDPLTIQSKKDLAEFYFKTGEFKRAWPLLETVNSLRESRLGPGHPASVPILFDLGFIYGTQKRYSLALDSFREGFRLQKKIQRGSLGSTPIPERLTLYVQQSPAFFGCLSLIRQKWADSQEALRFGLELVFDRKEFLSDHLSKRREALVNNLSPEGRNQWEMLSLEKASYNSFLKRGPGKSTFREFSSRMYQQEKRISELETAFRNDNPEYAPELLMDKPKVEEVAAALPKGSALVEFVRVQEFNWDTAVWTPSWNYYAFLLFPDRRIELVGLGRPGVPEKSAMNLLEVLKNSSVEREKAKPQIQASAQLYDLFWKPISDSVKSADWVAIAPDGVLSGVPFAGLKDPRGKYLAETKKILYVTSGRDLAVPGPFVQPTRDFISVTNPDLDQMHSDEENLPEENLEGAVRSPGYSRGSESGAGENGEPVTPPVWVPGNSKTALEEKQATEEAVLNLPTTRVLQVGAPAFFMPNQLDRETERTVKNSGVKSLVENPFIRTGLLLSGANRASEIFSGYDGIVTSRDISGMNLSGTDLVVLPNCKTPAEPDTRADEAVSAFRSSFRDSGARYLLMSLWGGENEIRQKQLFSFYRKYGEGMDPVQALKEVQNEAIAESIKETGSAPPGKWAFFVLQGRIPSPGEEFDRLIDLARAGGSSGNVQLAEKILDKADTLNPHSDRVSRMRQTNRDLQATNGSPEPTVAASDSEETDRSEAKENEVAIPPLPPEENASVENPPGGNTSESEAVETSGVEPGPSEDFTPTDRFQETEVSGFLGDPIHSGFYPNALAKSKGELVWSLKTGTKIRSSPTVRGGTVFFGTSDGNLWAVDGLTGKELWKFKTDRQVVSTPAVNGEAVFFGSDDFTLYCLDRRTGKEIWKFKTRGKIQSSPTLAEGAVFFGSDDGNLYAVDVKSGSEKWHVKVGNWIYSSPAVADGLALVGTDGGTLVAIGLADGEKKWEFKTPQPIGIYSSPSVIDGLVLFGSSDYHVYAIDVSTGQERWKFKTNDYVFSSPAVSGDSAYFGGWDGNLYSVDLSTGKENWRFKTRDRIHSAPSLTRDEVYVGSDDETFYAIDRKTGSLRWGYKTDHPVQSTPVPSEEMIYFTSSDGILFAVK